jgi:hypothetical protein
MSPPSCPPAIQSTETGAPFLLMAFAMASAWPSGKRESLCPWTISAGTSIRSATAAGERSVSNSRAAESGLPLTATRSYISHNCFSNFSQPPPVVTKIPAQSFLNTPSGNSASARFQ